MINNRQGGRRRGRGGQRTQNLGQPGGNRQDNRQRGNAAQLLEKYKSMARDAQLAGDRVQTEYYLQFADHYYRVLSESRARFEEQNPRRHRDGNDFDEEMDEDLAEAGDEQSLRDEDEREDRGQREQREGRGERERGDRGDRGERDRGDRGRGDRPRRFARDEEENRGNRSNGADRLPPADDRLAVDVLPPAIGRDEEPVETMSAEADDAPRPRRRARRPRVEDSDSDIAPAA